MSPTSPLFFPEEFPLFKMIEATFCLNDALFFARFTSHFVLTQPLSGLTPASIAAEPQRQRLAVALLARQREVQQSLRIDLDLLIDPLAETMADESRHFWDCAPGDELTSEDLAEGKTATVCTIDKEGATLYLSALRDANLWPAMKWPRNGNTIGATVDAIEKFRIPEYDASDECEWCLHVTDKFVGAVELVRKMHKDRLWGLCLDCYKAGGVKEGECRYEHFKPGAVAAMLDGPAAHGQTNVMLVNRSVSAGSSAQA